MTPSTPPSPAEARPVVLFTVDVEEFDLPVELGVSLDAATQISVSGDGLVSLLALLDRLAISATFFTTVAFARARLDLIAALAPRHELASHGMTHARFCERDLADSRQELQRLSAAPVIGFRRARMEPTSAAAVAAAGYLYNASFNPVWLPGRYNNRRQPRLPHFEGDVLNITASSTPLLRLPLFWLAIKNYPLPLLRAASRTVLAHDNLISTYVHPWEFADLSPFKLPWLVGRLHGPAMLARLEAYLRWLALRAEFITCAEFTRRARIHHTARASAIMRG